MAPVTDVHSHIVTPEVLALLERDGAAYNTRIAERFTRDAEQLTESPFYLGASRTPD